MSSAVARATIVHISDLHFGGGHDERLEKMVERVVREVAPDYLVVSGDLVESPSLLLLGRASEFIDSLLRAANIGRDRLVVVPGNHDCKLKGNWNLGLGGLLRAAFGAYFGNDTPRPPNDAGTLRRAKQWLSFARGGLKRAPFRVVPFAENGLVFFLFDSTPPSRAYLATGRVDDEQIREFGQAMDANPEWRALFKIAVVHHHPLPVPYVPLDLRSRAEESFMVLQNAGAYLRELSRHDVDLILHGHKHFAGFTRVAYDFPDERGTREIGVLSAGSATHGGRTDPSGNELNIVRIFEDGTAAIEQRYFRLGQATIDYHRPLIWLCDFESLRRRRRERAARRGALSLHALVKRVSITKDGFSEIEVAYEGCTPTRPEGLDGMPFEALEAPTPAYLRRLRLIRLAGTPPGTTLEVEETGRSLRSYASAAIKLGGRRRPEDGPFDVAYGYRLINAHALDGAAFQRRYPSKAASWEYATLDCDEDLAPKRLCLAVTFPDHTVRTDIAEFEVAAFHTPPGAKAWRRHAVETARISATWQARAGTSVELEVPDPVPGFAYQLRWRYELPDPGRHHWRRALLAELRTRLVGELDQRLRRDMVDWLRELADETVNRYPPIDGNEIFDVSLAIATESVQGESEGTTRLQFVAATWTAVDAMPDGSFASGEGCAGFAFEAKRLVFYARREQDEGYFITAEEARNDAALSGPNSTSSEAASAPGWRDCEVLLAVPVVDPSSGVVVGVLSISSASRHSRLKAFLDLDTNGKKDEEARLRLLTQMLLELMLSNIGERVPS